MEKTLTWGECMDYTFLTRDTWRNGGGRRSAETYTGYFTRLRGRSFPVDKIRPALITELGIELEEEGKVNGTINRFISAVSTVLNHCFTEEFISFKPPSFSRRKEYESIRLYYTKEQVAEIERVARDEFHLDHLGDIVRFAAYTGMRQGELLKLRVRDVDLNLNVIHVGGRPDNVTKAGNYRSIPIHTHLKPMLEKRCEYAKPSIRVFGDDWTDRYQLQRQFRNVTQRYLKMGDGYVFHSLRHSFATWHVQAGTPFRVLMDLMGHKNMVTTLIYGKSTDQGRATAIDSI
jgi:integrase